MPTRLRLKGWPFCVMLLALLLGRGPDVYGQTNSVTGTVLDETGMTLPGVSVLIKSTTIGTITDIDGKFQIYIAGIDNPVLILSYIGYQAKEITLNGQTQLEISLEADLQALSEVVVVGYGEQKKATLTGSVSQIQGKVLESSPQPNLSNSLAGRFSGIIASNRAGEPGYDGSSFTIRGLATTGNNDVLVVIDGVPGQIGGLERLSPNDIESVSVLKDASAAIYGSRAANGVILVTTKRGKSGKPTVSYNFNQGFSSPTRLPEMADAATYAQIRNEIAYYNNAGNGLNQVYSEAELANFSNGSDPINYPNTDWAAATLNDVALQNQHNLSVRGGSDDVSYFISLGKSGQDGLYKNGATEYNQYNFRTNIDADVTERLKVGISLSGRKEDRQYPTQGAGTLFRSIYRAYPTVPAVYPNGLPSSGIENSNPVVMATEAGGLNQNPNYVFNGILRASYKLPFLDGLSVDGFYSVDENSSRKQNFLTPYTLYNYDQGSDSYNPVVVGGDADQQAALFEEHYNQSMSVSNIKLNYKNYFAGHYVDVFVGYEQSSNSSHTMGASRLHFPTTETPELSQGGAAASDYNNYGSSYNFTRKSYLGRFLYNYNEKYMAEVQLRADGSSNFPEGSRYGFFPSVSAGYRISEESWFKNNVSFFNDLKIRASYGQLGNDNVGQFQYYDNYSFNNRYLIGNEVSTGIDLTRLGNPNITWEVAKKTDIALNAVWLNNFTTEVIYFKQNRSDILTARNASIPATSGIVNPYNGSTLVPSENIGEVKSSGIETSVGYNKTGDFSFGIAANFTYAKNELVFKDEAAGVLDYQRETGRSLNTYLLYNAIGIFRSQEELDATPHVAGAQVGDLIYEDYNGDGNISADDMVRSEYGNIPQMTFGLTLQAGYKNFDLSAVISGQTQVSQYVLPESGTVGNFYSTWADNRYSPSNTEGTYPRVSERSSSAVSGGLYRNNFWLNDASFARLKNIQIGYTLPESILERANIGSLRVYANAFNLFTLTGVKDFDPEGSSESGQFYPQQKILNLGLNIQF
ncbi:SusC/RagA family TonB-linked outer membrane protein [Arcticibacterium luteifluviistationis]|uniref:SusC/RagA family TonB-linked outer membrane protein n=1 Tax=Arcticibacterium luteifluviistationis TaxID=1784714 RepID=A0A2Z4GBN2_9BACT|nr:TonB-dependent receptor [Arcticibacterium luteifluviistationis]AWV98544.1 SusC/RagA family TonB-linked outer membrane protein [Arcticibacterium luteifluviistationis]